MRPHALLLLAALSLIAADKAKKPKPADKEKSGAKTDEELIQGKWRVRELWTKGELEDDPKLKATYTQSVYTFSGNQLISHWKEKLTSKGTYKLDSTKNPKEMIAKVKIFTGQEFTKPYIYKIEGDKLTLCLGETMPTDFTTKNGKRMLIILKRMPKKKPQPKD